MSKNHIVINGNPNPSRPDLRGKKPETVEEYLARGGKIKRLEPFKDIWTLWVQRELLAEENFLLDQKRINN